MPMPLTLDARPPLRRLVELRSLRRTVLADRLHTARDLVLDQPATPAELRLAAAQARAAARLLEKKR